MTPVEWSGLIGLGFAAGVAGGLLGVGGGILFVPALVVFADQSQLGAEATSLVASCSSRGRRVAPARLRQRAPARRADCRRAVPIGVLFGIAGQRRPERALELSFAGVQLFFAWQLAKKAGLR